MKRPSDWLLAVILAVGVFLWQRSSFDLWHIDLFHIQLASYAWHSGQPERMYTDYDGYERWIEDWYRPQADRLGAWGDENAYFYPPFLAGVLSPVSDVHVYVWRNSLFAINVILLFVFASQIVRAVGTAFSWRGFLWAFSLVLLCYPMARATKLAQIVPLLAVLFWEGLLRLKSARKAATVLIGVVMAVKIFPAGWVLLPLVKRQWRFVLGIAGTVAAIYILSITLMGWDIHLRWWDAVREFGSVVYTYFGNQSPAGWFTRAVLGKSLLGQNFDPSPLIQFVRALFILVFLGGTVLLLWVHRNSELPFSLENGLMISGLLLSLPVTWEHYFLFVLPALGALLYSEWRRGRVDTQSILLIAAAFFFTMKLTRFYSDSGVGKIVSGSQCFGLILFWVYCVKRLKTEQGQTRIAGI